MAFSSVLKFFLPKDRVFYSLFEEVVASLVKMGNTFQQALKETDLSNRNQLLKSLEELEHKNDGITHQIFIELGRNFITPFDREDIHYLATSLDDIADYLWGAAKRVVNYDVEDTDGTILQFADIIVKAIAAINTAVYGLRDMKDLRSITAACVQVNSFENAADDLLDISMMRLFSDNITAVELIKQKDIYQMLEIVTDKCEDVANVVESIIIKYS